MLVGRVHTGRIAHRRGEFAPYAQPCSLRRAAGLRARDRGAAHRRPARRRRGRVRRDRSGRAPWPRPVPVQAAHRGVPGRALVAPARAGHLRPRRGGARQRRLAVAAGERRRRRRQRRAGRAGAAGDARAPVRGRHQLRLPRGALRARLPRGRGHPLPRRAGGAGRGAAARRGDRGLADRPRRRAGIGARRGRRRAARGGLPGERRRRAGRAVRARTRRDGRRRHHGERGRGSLHAPGQRPAPLGAGPDRTGSARLAQHRRRTLAAAAVRWRRGRAGGRLVPAER